MNKYKYRAMKGDGSKIEGAQEAESREEVVRRITSNGYYPLKIEQLGTGAKEIKFNQKITTKDLIIFCRQMYTMLNAGVSITGALEMLEEQFVNKKFKKILGEIGEDVKKGEMLSESMEKYPNEFPKLLLSMIRSGEITGNMDAIMLKMSVHFEKEDKLERKVKSAMIYPIILSLVAMGAVTFIMVFVMPTFKGVFAEEDIDMPKITLFLLWLSEFITNHWIILILIIAAIVVGIQYYKRTKSGYTFFSKIKIKLPIIGDLNKKIITSRFTRTISTLLSSGVSILDAIPVVTEVLGNKIAEDEMNIVKERIMKGEGLSEPLREAIVFPDMLASMEIGRASCRERV